MVDALLRSADYRAAMALLMNWLSQAENVPLEDGAYSFFTLALRWMLGLNRKQPAKNGQEETWPLIQKFFDFLEANADAYWEVPGLDFANGNGENGGEEEPEEGLYDAAYAGMTYRDSADDNQEGSVAEGEGELHQEFDLERASERLLPHLRFLSTVARLWQIATHQVLHDAVELPSLRRVRAGRAHDRKPSVEVGFENKMHAPGVRLQRPQRLLGKSHRRIAISKWFG